MRVYSFNSLTKEFLSIIELSESDKNPFDKSQYLMPANAVENWPTVSASENEAIVFNGSGWSLTPDFRGTEGWHQTGEKIEISELGEALPVDFIDYDPVELAEEKAAEFKKEKAVEFEEAQEALDQIEKSTNE